MSSTLDSIEDLLLQKFPTQGIYTTTEPSVRITRHDSSTDLTRCFYEPCCLFVASGAKQVLYNNNSIIYDRGKYLLSTADIPALCRVIKATTDQPFLGVIIKLNQGIIADLLLRNQCGCQEKNSCDEKFVDAIETDEELLDTFSRLLKALLTKSEPDISIVNLALYEIHYRLLRGPLGCELRKINTSGTNSHRISKAMNIIKQKFRELLNMDDLAETVNMAPSSFYRNFKKITGISPLQYQKQIKLQEAQRLMLTERMDADTASYNVGYKSNTQFSREYKKLFGAPPKSNIMRLMINS